MVVRAERDQDVADAQAVDEAGQLGDGRVRRAGGRDLDRARRERVALRRGDHDVVGTRSATASAATRCPGGRRHRDGDRLGVAQPDGPDDLDAGRGVLREVVVERLDAVAPADDDGAVQPVPAQDERLLDGADGEPRQPDRAHDGAGVRRRRPSGRRPARGGPGSSRRTARARRRRSPWPASSARRSGRRRSARRTSPRTRTGTASRRTNEPARPQARRRLWHPAERARRPPGTGQPPRPEPRASPRRRARSSTRRVTRSRRRGA